MLESNHRLESAPDHTLGIEGHRFGIHHLGKTLVLHHLRVDAVASGARLVDDIGEHYGLTGLLLDATREGCSLSPLDVVGDAFAELQRAVLAPDLARLGRHAPVGCKLLLRNRHDKSIDVTHENAPLVEDHTARDKVTRKAGDWVTQISCGEDALDARSPHLFSRRYCSTMTIQPTPKRSETMPNRLAKNVLPSGIRTCPPSASAVNMRSASASFLASTESEKPSNLGLPCAQPSDAITGASPTRKHECMILLSLPGATMPGGGGSGLSL